jgi:hypothetical protein
MQKKIDKIRMKGMKKKVGGLFLKNASSRFFLARPLALSPAKSGSFHG